MRHNSGTGSIVLTHNCILRLYKGLVWIGLLDLYLRGLAKSVGSVVYYVVWLHILAEHIPIEFISIIVYNQ